MNKYLIHKIKYLNLNFKHLIFLIDTINIFINIDKLIKIFIIFNKYFLQ